MSPPDPLEQALQQRAAERRAVEQARQDAANDRVNAEQRQCEQDLQDAAQFQELGRNFLKRAGRQRRQKVYWSGCIKVSGSLGGSKIRRGTWVRAIVVEKAYSSSSSTGTFSSGTDLLVLADGRILTGYKTERQIADRLAAYLKP